MADTLPTVWPCTPHTLAKHAILRRYLEAWFPILTRQAANLKQQFGARTTREILFIDGFAGPGRYTGGEDGSPVIALKAVLGHNVSFPIPVRMLFIEERKDRFQRLKNVLAPLLAQAQASQNVRAVEPCLGDCDSVLNGVLDEFEQKRVAFGPALAFLDQFGYGAVSMDLIARILRYSECEVFSYLDYKDMNRWMKDETKWPVYTRAFGGDEWRLCIDLPEDQRRTSLLNAYKTALKDPKRGNAKYVASFAMFDKYRQPLYWLLFCTNSLKGLEEMKKAMWSVDKSGSFHFSDNDNPKQLKLLDDSFSQEWLAEELVSILGGKTFTLAAVRELVLTLTPCYLFKTALKALETGRNKRLKVVQQPVGRRAGTYPDEMLEQITVQFDKSLI